MGIGVDPVWRDDFTAFLADMGERSAATILDRFDRSADFGPGNCFWAVIRSRSIRAREAVAVTRRGRVDRAAPARSPTQAVI